MAKKEKKVKKEKRQRPDLLAFWKNWDDGQKTGFIRITGIALAIFAIFALVSMASYMMTWRQDQSLLRDPAMMDSAHDVANLGGKLGLKLADLFICRWFGIGSFALLILVAAAARRLVTGTRRHSLLRLALSTMTGAFILSLVAAFVGKILGLQTAMGSGLGGQTGAYVLDWSANLMGSISSVLLIALLSIGWLFFNSRRFAAWFNGLGTGEPRPRRAREEEPESEGDEDKEGEITEEEKEPESVVAPKPSVFGHTPLAPRPDAPGPAAPKPVAEPEPVAPQPSEPQPVAPKPQPAVQPQPSQEPANAGGFEVEQSGEISTDVNMELPRINMRDELPDYKFPPLDLLGSYEDSKKEVSQEELNRNNNKIRATLANYKIDVVDVKAVVGPTVTLYKIYPAPGVRIANIRQRQEDIALSLNAKGVRIFNQDDFVGIEVANDKPSMVPLRGLLNSDEFRNTKAELPVAIGCNIQKKVRVFDLADAPHLLVAGATKQGKSVGLNVLIASLLYAKHPSEMKMVFIDPKMVEFSGYAKLLKHYLAVLPTSHDDQEEYDNSIVTQPKDADKILGSLAKEMDDRFLLMKKALVNNVKLYNNKYQDRHLLPTEGHHYLPYIVVIIDEYADLIMSGGSGGEARKTAKSIMDNIIRLAQKGRAAGIHVVLATQRPSVDVVTGLIKSNFPTRIAFRTTTRVDSTTILDSTGAERLIGKGDMLYYAGVDTERIQCGFISNDEINSLAEFVGNQKGYKKSFNTPYYLPMPETEGGEVGMIDMTDLDERFEEAARMVVMTQKGSTSDLQRKLGMGYAKAGRVMDQLEAAGIVGPQEGSKPRQVLVGDFDQLQTILDTYLK